MRKIVLIALLVTAALCITPRVEAAGQPVLVVVAAPAR